VRLGVLVSGRGSNLEAILGAGLDVACVISNRTGVRALDVATSHGLACHVAPRSKFANAEARDGAIGAVLTDAGVELAVLAGYDQLLRPAYFAAFAGRTINIHPSLLPRHGGIGMVGLAVHRAVLAAGERETGATVHEVTADLDAGPILAQCRVPVLASDDPESLAARVLPEEHRLLIETLRALEVVYAPAAGPVGATSHERGESVPSPSVR
jgi:phosphoribosylglycinamide formyltransferase-1